MAKIDVGNLSEAETFTLAVEALGFLQLHRAIEAIKSALDEDGQAELAANLPVEE